MEAATIGVSVRKIKKIKLMNRHICDLEMKLYEVTTP